MRSTGYDPVESLSSVLEEQFQRHNDLLGELTECSQQPNLCGYSEDTLAALITSCRQAVFDTAQALRRMAEGTYGSCERCAAEVPLERLTVLPHARFCASCQEVPIG